MEGLRLCGNFGSYREATTSATVDDGGRAVSIKPGDRVFCSFVSLITDQTLTNMYADQSQVDANKEVKFFPNPSEVDISRNLDSYLYHGAGLDDCLGKYASRIALTAMLKVVCRLDNLRRAPGGQGQHLLETCCRLARLTQYSGELKKILQPGGSYLYMRADYGSYSPLPTSKLTPTGQNVYIDFTDPGHSDESPLGWGATSAEHEVNSRVIAL